MSALAEVTNSPRRIPISQKPQFILSPPSSSPTPTPTHDAFGFPIENNTVVVNGIQLSKQGEAAWKQYSSSSLCNFRTDALHSIVLKHGIPSHRRGDLWYQWSGAEEKCETSTLKYADYENKPCDKKIKQQIELDLPRTCPKHAAFLCENPEEEDPSKQIVGSGRTSIGKVLRAYAVRNPKLGYLQSMNFLAAMLYLVMDGNESKMFWTLTTIVEDILPGYFTAKLHKLLENVDAFSILLSQMYPKVAANLEKYGLNITFRAPTWFLCMYFTSLKSEVVARVWDAIFFNVKRCPDGAGGPAALSCIGLGIVDAVKEDILNATNIAECAQALQKAGDQILDAQSLVTRSFQEISTVAAMASRLAGPHVRGELKKKRELLAASRREHKRTMTARKPKRKRGHRRTVSDGDIPNGYAINEQEEQIGPMNSPGTNARIVARNKRRRIAVRCKEFDSSSSTSTSTSSTAVPFSPFATFKRWLTPKKVSQQQQQRRRAPPATAHVKRINFGSSMSSLNSSSSSSSSSSLSQRRPSLKLNVPSHLIGTPSKNMIDSPRGNFELKMKTTPAKIRAKASAANGYGKPPGTPT